jgi:hypothetical protein
MVAGGGVAPVRLCGGVRSWVSGAPEKASGKATGLMARGGGGQV